MAESGVGGTEEHMTACPACEGSGSVEIPHPSGYEEWGTIYAECPRCTGSGEEAVSRG